MVVLGAGPTCALAYEACTAADIIALEPNSNCPASAVLPCSIRSTVTLPAAASACVFDFGSRALAIGSASAGGGTIRFGSKVLTLKAGSLTVFPNGLIDGAATTATMPTSLGGMLTVQTSGAVTTLSAGNLQGRIDVSGRSAGGSVTITAGGVVTIGATINAGRQANFALAGGGTVRIDSAQDIVVTNAITVIGGDQSFGGGEIDLNALGRVEVSGTNGVLTIQGSEGGIANIGAGTQAIIKDLNALGSGISGSGGTVTILANQNVQVTGALNLDGSGTIIDGGGCGGCLCLESTFGNVVVNGDISADSGLPDGGGGEIDIMARGDITLGVAAGAMGTAIISAAGIGSMSCGGAVCIEAERDVNIQSSGKIDTSGGDSGGDTMLSAGRHMTVSGPVDVTGSNFGSNGGNLILLAGNQTSGNLLISNVVDVTGGSTDPENGPGVGGSADITGCNLTVAAGNGAVRARGSQGGDLALTARKTLTISGSVNASNTDATVDKKGTVVFVFPAGTPQPTPGGTILPPATPMTQVLCDHPGQQNCLLPCPTCGNTVVEYPETCDNGGNPPVNCDGCSAYCRLETSCDDGLVCTTDSCDPTAGCISLPVPPPCSEPTNTPSQTLTPSRTRTPTQTPTATRTPTITPSPPATSTPTTPPCLGDCDRNGSVSQFELRLSVSIINLCNGAATGCFADGNQQCTAADGNGDGIIQAGELTHIVSNLVNFAGGCPP